MFFNVHESVCACVSEKVRKNVSACFPLMHLSVFVSQVVFNVCVSGLGLSVKVCRGQPEASKCSIYAADRGQAAVNHLTDEA